jgi:hypothetical protein
MYLPINDRRMARVTASPPGAITPRFLCRRVRRLERPCLSSRCENAKGPTRGPVEEAAHISTAAREPARGPQVEFDEPFHFRLRRGIGVDVNKYRTRQRLVCPCFHRIARWEHRPMPTIHRDSLQSPFVGLIVGVGNVAQCMPIMQNTLDQSIVILAGREIPTVTLTAPLQRIFTSGLSALSTEPGAPCLGRR